MANTVLCVITECLPNALYKVQCGDQEFICYVAGRMRVNKIRVGIGDEVEVVLDPHKGKTTNRIVSRK